MQPTIKIIGLKALRNNIAKVTQSVAEGNEYIVIKHSMPILHISFPRLPHEQIAVKTKTDEVSLEPWKNFIGMLKNKKGPDPLKWQKKIRQEWETIK